MITRATNDNSIMSLINSIGSSIDEKNARMHIYNLNYQNIISDRDSSLMLSVVGDTNFKGLPSEVKDTIRANQLKQMLVTILD